MNWILVGRSRRFDVIMHGFEKYLKVNSIKHETSDYTPQQNGVADHMNRTLVEVARCNMIQASLPKIIWAELVNAAAFIRKDVLR